MSCEVANSPFPDPGYASPFNVDETHADKVDFAALKDFNYSFGAVDQGCVDPQNLSNAGSPAPHFDPSLTQDFTPDTYPSNLHGLPSSPYFQSVEQPFAHQLIPPHLQNQHFHRRSVSEPPDGAFMHHHAPQPGAPMTFHRDGTQLGPSRIEAPLIKRVKQSRVQPYKRSSRQPHPQPSQSRYQLRRSPAQSAHLQPTSVPLGMPYDQPPQPQQMHHIPFEQMPREPQYVSSRVCTPAPEAIDPFLDASPMPMVAPMIAQGALQGHVGNDPLASKSVTIEMDADELRALITDAVQKAVGALQADRSTAAADVVAQGCPVEKVAENMQAGESVAKVETMVDAVLDEEIVEVTGTTEQIGDVFAELDTQHNKNE